MHRLKALIWKAYKVRLRSPFTTALDVFAPIVAIIIYLLLKVLMGALSVPVETNSASSIFSRPTSSPLDPSRDLPQYLCNKVLFFSPDQTGQSALQAIGQQCGVELTTVSSSDELVQKLRTSLIDRIDYRKEGTDLSRSNGSRVGKCINLANGSEPSYQAGIIFERGGAQVYMTESFDNPVIYQPYTQGSTFNEYRSPQSDLNSGYHLFEICLASALNNANSRSFRVRRQATNETNSTTTPAPVTPDPVPPNPAQNLKWRIKPFPETATPQLIIFIFMVFQLAGNLCNAIATVIRISDNNESGLHHYIRSAGVTSGAYWAAQIITTGVHMLAQSLIITILLSIPTTSVLFDPIHEAGITVRYLLIATYGLAINAHAMFVGSLFTLTSHAVLVTCLLAVAYAMYPLFFMLQWSPYAFSRHFYLGIFFTFSNPVSNYQALLIVIYSVYVQTNQPLGFGQFSMSIVGGGLSDWSIGTLWVMLALQAVFWLVITIIIDQWRFTSTYSLIGFPIAMLHELICCNQCGPTIDDNNELEASKMGLKYKTAESAPVVGPKSSKSAKSYVKDPNRICCSLRNLTVYGPSTLNAHTKSNALKLTPEELKKLHDSERENASKTHQYLINRGSPRSAKIQSTSKKPGQSEDPFFLADAIRQNVVWKENRVCFEDLNLDFRFNQVSFVLGQTDLKELFFAAIMGLRPLSSGYIKLDGTYFSPRNLSLARRYIGHLSERDIFITEMTIFENLQFFGSLRDELYTEYDSESSFVLSLLHLTGRKGNLPMILTSRSARKLSMAVAAVGHTKLLLLVEPTLGLHWRPRCQVLNLLKKYKSIRSIVVDTSDVDEATAFGDRVLLLKDGRAFLDGSPARLAKKLSCGYWIYFDVAGSSDHKPGSAKSAKDLTKNGNLAALETLTNELFKEDKLLPLEKLKRPVYRELLRSDGSQLLIDQGKKENQNMPASTYDGIQSKISIALKVRQSPKSDQALCRLLKLFAENGQHGGFILSEVTYESIEDILVLMMSKAIYPDLPPDLLLSLSHKTHSNVGQRSEANAEPQVSVQRLTSDIQMPKTIEPIFSASMRTILRERLSSARELSIILASMLFSLVCVAIALYALQRSLSPLANSAATPATTNTDDIMAMESLFKQRVGLYIVGTPETAGRAPDASDSKYLSRWPGNIEMTGVVSRQQDGGKSDASVVTGLIHKNRDLAAALIFFDPATNDVTVLFEPQLAHAMISGIKLFDSYYPAIGSKISNRSSIYAALPNHSIEPPRAASTNVSRLLETSGNNQITISRRHFRQSWHEMVHGHLIRRLFYGIGLSLAEGVAIGVLVIAPLRHRSESSAVKVRTSYWIAMALFDLTISAVLVFGYLVLISWIESTYSASLLCKYDY